MKYLLLLIVLMGCKHKRVIQGPFEEMGRIVADSVWPKAVHNKCLDKWAIRTGVFNMGKQKHYTHGDTETISMVYDTLYFGIIRKCDECIGEGPYISLRDTILRAYLGDEFIFTDSLSAMKSYNEWMNRTNERIRASIMAALARDSIEKCLHTYN